jgi:hypothetical protein
MNVDKIRGCLVAATIIPASSKSGNVEQLSRLASISTALGAIYSTSAVINIFGVFSASMVGTNLSLVE